MTTIVIRPFGGMVPRRGIKHLPHHSASQAVDCILLSGELRPLHSPALLMDFYPPDTHAERVAALGQG